MRVSSLTRYDASSFLFNSQVSETTHCNLHPIRHGASCLKQFERHQTRTLANTRIRSKNSNERTRRKGTKVDMICTGHRRPGRRERRYPASGEEGRQGPRPRLRRPEVHHPRFPLHPQVRTPTPKTYSGPNIFAGPTAPSSTAPPSAATAPTSARPPLPAPPPSARPRSP